MLLLALACVHVGALDCLCSNCIGDICHTEKGACFVQVRVPTTPFIDYYFCNSPLKVPQETCYSMAFSIVMHMEHPHLPLYNNMSQSACFVCVCTHVFEYMCVFVHVHVHVCSCAHEFTCMFVSGCICEFMNLTFPYLPGEYLPAWLSTVWCFSKTQVFTWLHGESSSPNTLQIKLMLTSLTMCPHKYEEFVHKCI